MKNFIDTWGFYKWSVDFNEEKDIHPDDLEKMKKLFPIQKIFHCIDCTDEYLILKYENKTFINETYRVKPLNYEQKNEPNFKLNEKVKTKNSEKYGEIREIAWHFQKNSYFYYLNIDGKSSSRRYFDFELEKV